MYAVHTHIHAYTLRGLFEALYTCLGYLIAKEVLSFCLVETIETSLVQFSCRSSAATRTLQGIGLTGRGTVQWTG